MPSPAVDDAKRKLAWIHAERSMLNRKRYLEALDLPTHNDEILRQLTAAAASVEPVYPTSAIG